MNYSNGYAPTNGINMYYEIHGSGYPLVLIHGGGSTIQSCFGKLIPLLAKHFRVVAMELQAHGHTEDRNAASSFEQDADDVAALLSHLQISKAHILGFSNGGNTAMQLAVRHPLLINKLVIIAAFYKREGMMQGFFEFMEHASLANMPKPLQEAYLQINNDQQGLQTMHDRDAIRMQTFKDWDDAVLTSIKAPALFIAGDKDVVTVPHTLKMASLVEHSSVIILPGAHGDCIGEICTANPNSAQPTVTAMLVKEFL
ncbi:MAG: alpha/beta hydrolase [Chitinophagaceae bacterium]